MIMKTLSLKIRFIFLFFAPYLLKSKVLSQNQTSHTMFASFSSLFSSLLSSLKVNKWEFGLPTLNQKVKKADSFFHTLLYLTFLLWNMLS